MEMPQRVINLKDEKANWELLGITLERTIPINLLQLKDKEFRPTHSIFYIKEVAQGSIAEKYGISKGDRLLKVNDVDVSRNSRILENILRILPTIDSLTVVALTPEEMRLLPEIERIGREFYDGSDELDKSFLRHYYACYNRE